MTVDIAINADAIDTIVKPLASLKLVLTLNRKPVKPVFST